MIEFTISENEENQRLDKFIRKYLKSAPLSYIYKIIRKDVKINGKRRPGETLLQKGDILTIYISDEEALQYAQRKPMKKAKRQFGIVHEDENVIIVEKPVGLLTHGDSTEKKNTLVNQVVGYLIETGAYEPSKEKTFTPASVNRLDRNTSGLVIFGKNHKTVQSLNQMVKRKEDIEKYYITIVEGTIRKTMRLNDKMVKDTRQNMVSVVGLSEEGREMETIVRPIASNNNYTLAEIQLLTGRTHQIRAHLASRGYPILGDTKYGYPVINRKMEQRFGLTTQLLHAYKLIFRNCAGHLAYLEGQEIKTAYPERFQEVIEGLL